MGVRLLELELTTGIVYCLYYLLFVFGKGGERKSDEWGDWWVREADGKEKGEGGTKGMESGEEEMVVYYG